LVRSKFNVTFDPSSPTSRTANSSAILACTVGAKHRHPDTDIETDSDTQHGWLLIKDTHTAASLRQTPYDRGSSKQRALSRLNGCYSLSSSFSIQVPSTLRSLSPTRINPVLAAGPAGNMLWTCISGPSVSLE
jgi:hypothetical protein